MGISSEDWQRFAASKRLSVDDGTPLASPEAVARAKAWQQGPNPWMKLLPGGASKGPQKPRKRVLSHESTIQRPPDPQTHYTGQDSELECRAGNGSLEAGKGQETGAGRVHIRFVSVRKRLCDPDNLCEKWALDNLRYCRVITGDEPDKITLETTQRKAVKGEAEHTEVEVTWP